MKGGHRRVVLIGDCSVGKTSILHFLVRNSCLMDPRATTAASFSTYSPSGPDAQPLDIWDTAGMEQYRSLNAIYFRGAAAAVLVFDVTRPSTFDALNVELTELEKYNSNDVLLVVAANKCDLLDQRRVSNEQISRWCAAHNCPFYCTSAISGLNIPSLFQHISTSLPSADTEFSTTSSLTDAAQKQKKRCC